MYATTLMQNYPHEVHMNLGNGFKTTKVPYSKSIWYFETLEQAESIVKASGGFIYHVKKPFSTNSMFNPKELFVVFYRNPKHDLFACEYVYGKMEKLTK